MSNSKEIRRLDALIRNAQKEAEELKEKSSDFQRKYSQKLKQIEEFKNKKKDLSPQKEVEVSDHAIVRYLERVSGVDLEPLKKKIVTESITKFINRLGGNGKFPNGDEFTVVAKNYKVITIIKNEEKK